LISRLKSDPGKSVKVGEVDLASFPPGQSVLKHECNSTFNDAIRRPRRYLQNAADGRWDISNGLVAMSVSHDVTLEIVLDVIRKAYYLCFDES
jgi:hypothetical protein